MNKVCDKQKTCKQILFKNWHNGQAVIETPIYIMRLETEYKLIKVLKLKGKDEKTRTISNNISCLVRELSHYSCTHWFDKGIKHVSLSTFYNSPIYH
jgi:hypothetical protein